MIPECMEITHNKVRPRGTHCSEEYLTQHNIVFSRVFIRLTQLKTEEYKQY